MKQNVLAPSVGESITEVSILKWSKPDGAAVKEGEVIVEIESDKATVEVVAPQAGVLKQLKQPGDRIPIGEIIGSVDSDGKATATASPAAAVAPAKTTSAMGSAAPAISGGPSASGSTSGAMVAPAQQPYSPGPMGAGPGARKAAAEGGTPLGGAPAPRAAAPAPSATPAKPARAPYIDQPGDRRVPMSMLRQRIAERLVQAQHDAAILTTFNEVDMSAVMALRAKHKESFKAKHGVGLGFMSFFTRACLAALKQIPEVNGMIDGRDTIYHDYYDIGIAVGTERGLVVPVIRGADKLDFVGIEKAVAAFGQKAKDGKLSMADLSGGTFTISNGGTYGSLMSTPILNPPQSAILGMHKIQDRPMAINGKVEIRPMMYLALSYDHRLVDGKGAVTFLVQVKEHLEQPEKLGLDFL